ncbi:hypothetical protein NPIL_353021 [Nephila pilipes]|uniref:Uncharacterized protein n=1 Tax=Nephila pilipes TaxID=299642 RepID=A0A8X6PP98_NEPPI|nr:hypothetical protein NPIL_353021 [Nephila pilipes]
MVGGYSKPNPALRPKAGRRNPQRNTARKVSNLVIERGHARAFFCREFRRSENTHFSGFRSREDDLHIAGPIQLIGKNGHLLRPWAARGSQRTRQGGFLLCRPV